MQRLIAAAAEAADPVKQLRLVTSFEQAEQYDTLVYDPESGVSHARPKGVKKSVWPHAWSGTFVTAGLALQAAKESGLQPTAIFYFFGPGGEKSG